MRWPAQAAEVASVCSRPRGSALPSSATPRGTCRFHSRRRGIPLAIGTFTGRFKVRTSCSGGSSCDAGLHAEAAARRPPHAHLLAREAPVVAAGVLHARGHLAADGERSRPSSAIHVSNRRGSSTPPPRAGSPPAACRQRAWSSRGFLRVTVRSSRRCSRSLRVDQRAPAAAGLHAQLGSSEYSTHNASAASRAGASFRHHHATASRRSALRDRQHMTLRRRRFEPLAHRQVAAVS